MKAYPPEKITERRVTYTIQHEGRLYVFENVPARVNDVTGEQLFAPRTVERIQHILWSGAEPVRTLEAPVYDFAA